MAFITCSIHCGDGAAAVCEHVAESLHGLKPSSIAAMTLVPVSAIYAGTTIGPTLLCGDCAKLHGIPRDGAVLDGEAGLERYWSEIGFTPVCHHCLCEARALGTPTRARDATKQRGGLMNPTDHDPFKRWLSISDWYAEFAAEPHSEFLAPMVGLTAWVAKQPFAAQLFPCTSHAWLCVQLHSGNNPDLPFFSCISRGDGQFECELWAAVGRSLGKRLVPVNQSCEVFKEFVGRLYGVALAGKPGLDLDFPLALR